jgi:hypothetical protein
MNGKDITTLIDELIKNAEADTQVLSLEAADALKHGDYAKHDEVYGKIKPFVSFTNKLRDLRLEWEKLSGQMGLALRLEQEAIKPPESLPVTEKVVSVKEIASNKKKIYTSPRKTYALKVTFPDGTSFCEQEAWETFCKTVEHIGVERVFNLKLGLRGGGRYPLVSEEEIKGQGSKKVGNYFVQTHSSSADKVSRLKDISRKLNSNLKIEFDK